jgi:DNA processing protein
MTRQEAEIILQSKFKLGKFYDEQWGTIEKILKGERVLLIEKTGFGKSLCFQFPATVFSGTTVVFSPLIALMRDQVKKLNGLGITAKCINSEQTQEENTEIIEDAKQGKIKILYIAPERQENSEWLEATQQMKLSMVVVDEAHCISVWGHDFRPAFRHIIKLVKLLPAGLPVLATTATATEVSLKFTDNIAKLASKEYKVVVSGFAKGVDKQALDSAINYKGQSIIVLPQGIMTFNSGFKTYYKQIVDGDVLVLSTFFPKAPWKAELAMARNPIIYGLADEIYVAESSEKGGTWSGVIDELRKGRVIYIRKPQLNEKNANNILISKGAVPVDFEGLKIEKQYSDINVEQTNIVSEPENQAEDRIITLLKHGEYSAKEIIDRLQLKWTEYQLKNYLKTQKEVESIKKKTLKYRLKQLANIQGTLF